MISGPSGVGKGTLVKRLLQEVEGVGFSISVTTRSPRPGEQDGREYFFYSKEEFFKMVQENGFLEWAEVHGNYYGTPRRFVEQVLAKGQSLILEIDVQGALQVKEKMPEARLIFILPPSFEELQRRIEERATDVPHIIARRMKTAVEEIASKEAYHYQIVNDDLDQAYQRLKTIILKELPQ